MGTVWIRNAEFRFSVTLCHSDYLSWQVSCWAVEKCKIYEWRQVGNNCIKTVLCLCCLTVKKDAFLLLN